MTEQRIHTNEAGVCHNEFDTAQARAEFFAGTIGKEAPARLLSEDGAPSPELMSFCMETGMSLDWVFLGDLKAMIRATYRHQCSGARSTLPERI